MSLIKGRRYTWSEIVDESGADGSPPYYMLHRNGAVVAGCFTMELNPEAPLVVHVGKGPLITGLADIFSKQTGPIPVCVKSGMGEWLCCGDFKLVRSSADPVEIASHTVEARRQDIYKLLFLAEVACPRNRAA